ncbi:uroporphyrinogen decarboxylase family protein [Candidatus Bipolaricaulota bacterium]|nr:uroporphyrinogen decarboxylase family protein [Candidatus Bipolaricaulota bacterium]
MTSLGLLNWVGRRKRLRLLGTFFHGVATSLDFSTLIRIAGRRLVTASAAAPAILQTCGDMEGGLKEPQLLYEAMCFTVEEMELDTFCLASDLSLEAEACGCDVRFGERDLPTVISHPLETTEDFGRLEVPDPAQDGRMPVFLEAMELLEKNYTMLKAGL